MFSEMCVQTVSFVLIVLSVIPYLVNSVQDTSLWVENFIPEENEEHPLTYSEEESRRVFSTTTLSSPTAAVIKKNLDTKNQTPVLSTNKKDVKKNPVPRSRDNKNQGSTKTMMDLMENDDAAKKDSLLPHELNQFNIKQTMERIAATYNHVNITVDVVGKTAEYRDLVLMTMSKPDDDEPRPSRYRVENYDRFVEDVDEKKIILIVYGLSNTQSVAWLEETRPFENMLKTYIEHLDKFDILLMPMANPDGYNSASNKNLSPQGACSGVSLDRNFDISWTSHKNISSCNRFYPGPAPFSEPETRAVRDVINRHSHKIAAFIHCHSSVLPFMLNYQGDAILYPKGFSETNSDDDRYIDLKGEVEEAMKKANFQTLTVEVQTLYERYGLVYGTSVDYAASVFGIPFSFEFAVQPIDSDIAYEAHQEFVWEKIVDIVFNYIYTHTKIIVDEKK